MDEIKTAADVDSHDGHRSGDGSILSIQNLRMYFPIVKGLLRRTVGHTRAVDGVSFDIRAGEVFGLVGESGCGKTTLGRCIARILKPTDGHLIYRTREGVEVDLAEMSDRQMRPFRRDIRMVFQDPFGSLNPRLSVLDIVGEVLKVNRIAAGGDLEQRVGELLRKVGLSVEYLQRYPHAFSGGERQRIGIARALAPNPCLVICDEAVSALDVSIRAQTINLLQDLQEEFNLTYLFVAHDLSVVEHIADRVGVMYVGKLVEIGPTNDVYYNTAHPYTEALIAAVPVPDPATRAASNRVRLQGDVADASAPPTGCYFHPRCPYATDRCRTEEPKLRPVRAGGHLVACHHSESLDLKGVVRIRG